MNKVLGYDLETGKTVWELPPSISCRSTRHSSFPVSVSEIISLA